MAHSHRAGKLKQTNKKNKRSTASKRSLSRRQGGKVAGVSIGGAGVRKSLKSITATNEGSAKANRLNAAKQKRNASKKSLLQARRGLIASVASSVGISASRALSTPPPRVVGIISLSEQESELEDCVRQFLVAGADRVIACGSDGETRSVTAAYDAHVKGGQPHLTLLTNSTSFHPQYSTIYSEEDASVNAALDLCRVCDLVLFLVDSSSVTSSSAISSTAGSHHVVGGGMSIATSIKSSANTAHLDHVISDRGDRVLTAIKAQGMPTSVTLIVHKEIDGDSLQSTGGAIIERGFDDEMDEEDDDDGDDDDDVECVMSLCVTTHRSSKSIRRANIRRRAELKKYISRFASTEFGENSKVFEIDIAATEIGDKMEEEGGIHGETTSNGTTQTKSEISCAALVRMLCTISAAGPTWVVDSPRPFLITDGSVRAPCKDVKAVQYDETTQELKLTGYVRGSSPWNVNHLAHVPHLGTFAIKNIKLAGLGSREEQLPPIVAIGRKRVKKNDDNVTMDSTLSSDEGILLAESNNEERESLEMFASPDALKGEQNLIGFEDEGDNLGADDDANDKKNDVFYPGTSRPAGWSDYQSAWLDALGDNNNDDDEEDRGELAFALNKKNGDATTVGGGDFMDDDDNVNAEEKRALLVQRKQDRQSDLQFPDEVDYEEEGSARDRYARYRSLKSFRKSYWDPKENLPETYGAVYHFSSFKSTQKDVMLDMKEMSDIVMKKGCGVGLNRSQCKEGDNTAMENCSDHDEDEAVARACVPPGAYVTITLEGVPPQSYARLSTDAILTAVCLLPHENKVSVLHMGLSQSLKCENDSEVPIKSKDVLTFRCGWRTWQSRPVFSQNNLNSDKHKFERFMPTGGAFFACTLFGPVTYAPCPVLMFREATEEGLDSRRRELLANGSMLGADADRIVLKRIILTGYPTRVHKRHATVKYMFYNPEDVRWFQPAGLTTKHGLQGNIIQSVGDHGVMKCLFNAPIKQHDTVCLTLYKRIYPKLAPSTGEEGGQHLVVL